MTNYVLRNRYLSPNCDLGALDPQLLEGIVGAVTRDTRLQFCRMKPRSPRHKSARNLLERYARFLGRVAVTQPLLSSVAVYGFGPTPGEMLREVVLQLRHDDAEGIVKFTDYVADTCSSARAFDIGDNSRAGKVTAINAELLVTRWARYPENEEKNQCDWCYRYVGTKEPYCDECRGCLRCCLEEPEKHSKGCSFEKVYQWTQERPSVACACKEVLPDPKILAITDDHVDELIAIVSEATRRLKAKRTNPESPA